MSPRTRRMIEQYKWLLTPLVTALLAMGGSAATAVYAYGTRMNTVEQQVKHLGEALPVYKAETDAQLEKLDNRLTDIQRSLGRVEGALGTGTLDLRRSVAR